MGKACSMITGIGLAGALVGLNIYLLMEPKEQHKIKREAGNLRDEKSGAEAGGTRLTG